MVQNVTVQVENNKGEMEDLDIIIRSLKTRQYGAILKIVGRATRQIKENEELMNTFKLYFADTVDEDWKDQETGQILASVQSKLQTDQIGAIAFLLENLPDELIELISIASNLKQEFIEDLELDNLVDIVLAIIEENDFNKLQEVGKKLVNGVKDKINATSKENKQANHLRQVTND